VRVADEITKGTLAWCNEQREGQGQEPLDDLPTGKIEDPWSCPCGDATGLHVDLTHYREVDEAGDPIGDYFPLPRVVQDFVAKFDDEQYPEYIEEGS